MWAQNAAVVGLGPPFHNRIPPSLYRDNPFGAKVNRLVALHFSQAVRPAPGYFVGWYHA